MSSSSFPIAKSRYDANDPAPWWVRELRPYGLTGLLLAAACWYVFDTNAKKDEQIKSKDARIESQSDAVLRAYNYNSYSQAEAAKSNYELTRAVNALGDKIN